MLRQGDRNVGDPRLYNATNPAFDLTMPSHTPLTTKDLKIERKAFGIPFKVTDQKALDAATVHHNTQVEVDSAERLLVPFWIGHTQVGGTFRGSVYVPDELMAHVEQYIWKPVPPHRFSFPFPDHVAFNQVCASYEVPPQAVEACLSGSHVPSMLISRYELLEECEAMKCPPRLLPFERSTTTALECMKAAVSTEILETAIHNELRKHYGQFSSHHATWTGLVHEAVTIRPVFLPVFKLLVRTQSHNEPIVTWVCGATGHVHGPVIHQHSRDHIRVGAAGGIATFLASFQYLDPTAAAFLAAAGSFGASHIVSAGKHRDAMSAKLRQESEGAASATMFRESDAMGFKWSVEAEEQAEYIFREELRFKARRRAEFEQRVREEAARDEALGSNRSRFAGRTFRTTTRVKHDKESPEVFDPLGYYAILDLVGKERSATTKEISKAFREAARLHHPDALGPAAGKAKADAAKLQMQKIVEAYNILRDAKLRKEYDCGVLTAAQ